MISQHDIETRKKYILEAKESNFLDAVFLIYYYNDEILSIGPKTREKPDKITPEQVFGKVDEKMYNDAIRKSEKLLIGSIQVGRAFFKYAGTTLSYEEAVKQFHLNNPGFSDRSYNKAIHLGIRDMH